MFSILAFSAEAKMWLHLLNLLSLSQTLDPR